MAHIFRARLRTAQDTAKELVIKRVLPHLVQNRDFIEMFIDEARISMPLNHGNIVQVYEFGQVGKDFFLAMEYVHGRNLETVLNRVRERGESVPIPVALYIASEVAKGLGYAHRFRDPHDRPTGIIHRDVSPQNILVGFQGGVKLTDFGIAKARSRIRQTGQGIIRGKACYLSPEQAECRDLDGRSDQFSLGAVLYEMLTGARAFEGENEVATLDLVRHAQVQAPSVFRPEVPPEVDGAVMKALSRDPGRRFEQAGMLQVVLSRALHTIAPDFTSVDLADWMRKHFSDDITREITQRTTKERMLERLARERADVDHSGLTTGEILQMGTLAIHSGKARPASRTRTVLVVSIIVLVLGTGFGLWAGWPAIRTMFDGKNGGATASVDGGAATQANIAPEEPQVATPSQDAGVATDEADAVQVAVVNSDRPKVRFGFLNLNSRPWALVDIDGKRLKKHTPIFRVKVRAGKHRLRFFNPKLKIGKTITVWVRPNRTKTVSVQLTEP
jgi:tRNA A-37 threonylcarbamoyl transferase component Bud32